MNKGTIKGIYLAPEPVVPMIAVAEAHAVPGRGLEGDRYFTGAGTFSKPFPNSDSELTLIEGESLETFNRESGGSMTPADSRRNILTQGIRLNDLVGREFTIGGVRFRAHGLCEPCAHLKKLTGQPVLPGLVGGGGLRAQILSEGVIRLGDSIESA